MRDKIKDELENKLKNKANKRYTPRVLSIILITAILLALIPIFYSNTAFASESDGSLSASFSRTGPFVSDETFDVTISAEGDISFAQMSLRLSIPEGLKLTHVDAVGFVYSYGIETLPPGHVPGGAITPIIGPGDAFFSYFWFEEFVATDAYLLVYTFMVTENANQGTTAPITIAFATSEGYEDPTGIDLTEPLNISLPGNGTIGTVEIIPSTTSIRVNPTQATIENTINSTVPVDIIVRGLPSNVIPANNRIYFLDYRSLDPIPQGPSIVIEGIPDGIRLETGHVPIYPNGNGTGTLTLTVYDEDALADLDSFISALNEMFPGYGD